MDKKEAVKNIKKLSSLNGISGFEEEVGTYVAAEWSKRGKVSSDGIKNVYVAHRNNKEQQPVVQLDAHSDEVGFVVQAIQPNGLLRFLPVGGWVASNVAAQKVRVRTRSGNYRVGIVTSKPPHFMTEEERQKGISFDGLSIDIGAQTAAEVSDIFDIAIGAPVVPDVDCVYDDETGLFLGKAFDCRIGVACLMDVLSEIEDEEYDFNVIGTLTSQEEVGLRGAQVAVRKVKPAISIVFEGCPADDFAPDDYMTQSAVGKGPMLRHFDVSMITNPEFQAFALEVGKKYGLPVQDSVRKGGGTNGASINLYDGAPAIVVGIPVRYAHTHHCYVSFDDYEAAKQLVLGILSELNQGKISRWVHPFG